jgi:hypothetical protein
MNESHGQRIFLKMGNALLNSSHKTDQNLGGILKAMATVNIDSPIDSTQEPNEAAELGEKIRAVLVKMQPAEIDTLMVDLAFFGAGGVMLAQTVDFCRKQINRTN